MASSVACSWISRTKLASQSLCAIGRQAAGPKLSVCRRYNSTSSASPYRLIYSYSYDEQKKQQHVPLYHRLKAMTKGMFFTPLDLAWAGGYQLRFPNLWLRENCQCHECMDPHTRQRLVNVFKIPFDLVPREVRTYVDRAEIDWPDGHQTSYSIEWLRRHHFGSRGPMKEASFTVGIRSDVAQTPKDSAHQPSIEYGEVMASDTGVKKLAQTIDQLGYSLLSGCPPTPEASREVLERLSNFGLAHKRDFWDTTVDFSLKDTTESTQSSRLRTDSTFATEPPRIKMLHLLSHEGSAEGDQAGGSVLVDGFEAARLMLRRNNLNTSILSKVYFHAHSGCDKDAIVQPAIPFPVLNLHPATGTLYQVRWDNASRAPRCDFNGLSLSTWYVAAKKFADIIENEAMGRSFQLEPGTPIIFDNWRMLHGSRQSVGRQRICGGYLRNDDFASRLAALRDGRAKIIRDL